MSLIRKISNRSQAGYGVNILEQAPPTIVQGAQTGVIGIVGDFPWGPYDLTRVGSTSELFEEFAPIAFGVLDDYPSLKAFINKPLNTVVIKRIAVTGALAATETFDDAGAVASVDVAAAYPGGVGNQIFIEWADGTTPATDATMIVTVQDTSGTVQYSRTYVDVVSGTTVTDPGDPFVTVTANVAIVARPATAVAAALTGGADGTAVSGDWTGTAGSFVGVRAFLDANAGADIIIGAEVPSGFITDFNVALTETVEGACVFGVPSTPAGLTTATAVTFVQTNQTDRLMPVVPRVQTANTLATGTVTVDGNAFAAAAIAGVLPEESPGGVPGREFLSGITALESGAAFSRTDYDTLLDAGGNGFFSTRNGFIVYGGVTSSTVSGLELVSRRRMTDFITGSLAQYFEEFVGRLLDLDLAGQRLGPITGPEAKGVEVFLQGLQDDGRIAGWSTNYFLGTQAEIDSGIWPIEVKVDLFAPQQSIVLITQIGTTVVIEEA